MRKRFVTTIILCILCALCALGLTACDGGKTEEPVSVSGKTFVFVSIHGEYPDSAEAETKAEWNEIFEGTNEVYKDKLLWIFDEDGMCRQEIGEEEILRGAYVQNGNVLEITGEGFDETTDFLTAEGNNLVFKNIIKNEDGSVLLTQVQTFKLLEE